MEKRIKARKKHICDVCEKNINIGCFYIRHKSRVALFEDERQIGIKYLSFSICFDCHSEIEKDRKEIEEYTQLKKNKNYGKPKRNGLFTRIYAKESLGSQV